MFRKTRSNLPTSPVDYPSGTFVHTEKGYFYIVAKTKRYRIISERVLSSWSPPRVVETTEAAVSKYRIAAKMKFRNGSLIWNLADGKIYLIENGKRRAVLSPDALTRIGATKDDPVVVSDAEVKLHEIGEDLN